MYKIISISLLFILTIAKANSGFDLLKIDYIPQAAALAGCEYLKKDGQTAMNYNPAALAVKDRTLFSAGYSKYLDDGQTGFINASTDAGWGNLGLEISWLNIENLEGREIPTELPQYKFDAGYLNMAGGYAYSINEKFHLGVAGKYLIEKNEYETANGFALSAGLKITELLPGTVFSLAGNNFGKMNELYKAATPLPSNIESGVAYLYNFSEFTDFSVTGAVKSSYLTEDKKNKINCGLEIGYLKNFFLRGGYRFDNEGLPFSAGFGINYAGFGVDYSFSSFSDEFGQIHSFALNYSIR